MGHRGTTYVLLIVGLVFSIVALYGYRALRGSVPEPSPRDVASASPRAQEKVERPAVEDPAMERDGVRPDRLHPEDIQTELVSPELLSVLHACMAAPELRPAPGAAPNLRTDPRLLDDCLRGSDALGVLRRLSASLSEMREQDREDAVLLLGYLAHRLLRDASTAEERSAIIGPVLAAYRTVTGPHLQRTVDWLLARAYMRKDDLRGVASSIQLALEQELEAGAVPHVLGPLLAESFTAPRSTTQSFEAPSSEDARSAQEALEAMKEVVGRAVPRAIELGLTELGSEGEPYELRDALRLLEYALFASPDDSRVVLDEIPRLLDALAALDLTRIQNSGITQGTLSGLLSQAEARLLMAGAEDLDHAPPGGRTSPADLRSRWVMEDERIPRPQIFGPEHKQNRPPEFR